MKRSRPWEKSPRPIREPGAGFRWRRGSIYCRNHPSRCSSSWGRTWLEERRQRDQVTILVTASDAAIFGAQVAGDACIFARVDVDAAIFGVRRGRLTRVYLPRAYDVADAGISWTHARRPTRVSFNARVTWRRGHLLELASMRASS